jgi:hypothetical protein
VIASGGFIFISIHTGTCPRLFENGGFLLILSFRNLLDNK